MTDRGDKFAFHAVDALELGHIGRQRIKSDDLAFFLAVAVTRKIIDHVVAVVAARGFLGALVDHRVTRQDLVDPGAHHLVKLLTHDLEQGFSVDLLMRQAKPFFIGPVVKAKTLCLVDIGDQGRHGVRDLAQLHLAGA